MISILPSKAIAKAFRAGSHLVIPALSGRVEAEENDRRASIRAGAFGSPAIEETLRAAGYANR